MPQTILLVDDEPLNLDLLEQELTELGYAIEKADSGRTALDKLAGVSPDLVLLDYQMPGMNGVQVLTEIKKRQAGLPVIMITAYGTIERAVEAIKSGADDFVTKPFDPDHLALVVKKALEQARLKSEVELLAQELAGRYRLMAGKSTTMTRVIEQAKKAASSKTTVLLLGESGTGKELFARSIHEWSERAGRPFVAINCVGLSKELLESELFGHERGAFTGAISQKIGRLELADQGTLFLDEVGDIPLELQPKLLRVLQDHEFERLGSTRTLRVNIRLIAATNRDLAKAVAERDFRSDLYYRLNVFPIRMPPLRDRRDDIPLLVRYFVQKFARKMNKQVDTIPSETMNSLVGWEWPGNVRELENFMERSVILSDGAVLRAPLAELSTSESGSPVTDTLVDLERQHIIRVLRETGGVIAGSHGAASRLGMKRTTLQSRIIKMKISREEYEH